MVLKSLILSCLVVLHSGFIAAEEVLRFEKRSADLGNITDTAGVVKEVFTFTNTSSSEIALQIETSCSCLKAESSAERVIPGGEGTITLTFNPYHTVGKVDLRTMVYVLGKERSPYILDLSANVIKTDPWDYLPVRIGPLALKRDEVSFPMGEKALRVLCANTSDKPIEPVVQMVPSWLEAKFTPSVIPPGEEADLVLKLRSSGEKTAFPIKVGGSIGLIKVLIF